MKKKRQRITKRKSKRVIAAAKINAKLEILSKPKPAIPVRKSRRIVSSGTIAKSIPDVYEDEKKLLNVRPIRKQYVDIPYEYTCADFSDSIRNRLKLYSCFCCDNYRLDKTLGLLCGRNQEKVNQKRYGCRRKSKIKLKISYSSSNKNSRFAPDPPEGENTEKRTKEKSLEEIAASRQPSKKLKQQIKTWKKIEGNKKNEAEMKKTIFHRELLKVKCERFCAVAQDMATQQIRQASHSMEVMKKNELLAIQADHDMELKKVKRKQYYLAKKNKEILEKIDNGDISFVVNRALKGISKKKRADVVLDMVMDGSMFGPKGQQAGKKFVRKEVRKTYPAWRLSQAKDTAHQGCLNLQGIEAVRQVEKLEHYERGMMPSKSAIWREGDELLKQVGYPLFKPKKIVTRLGEYVILDFEMLFRFVLRDNGLEEIAQRESVEMAFSVDAAQLSDKTSHIYGGCKNVDIRSRDRYGNLRYVYEEDGVRKYTNLQSNANVYLMIMVYAKDGKQSYRHFFKEWFEFINKIKAEGLPYRDEANPAIKPVLIRIPQDTSSIQKALNMGGACKACDLFCHMCACKSYGANSQLLSWREGHLRCQEYCLNKENPPAKCHHWSVDDKNEIARKKQSVFAMILLDEIRSFRLLPECFKNQMLLPSALKMHYRVNSAFPTTHVEEDPGVQSSTQVLTSITAANRFQDPRHIDFKCPTQACEIRTAYSSMLDTELISRRLFRYCSSSVEVKQKYLRLSIRNGQYIQDIRRAINRWCDVGTNNKLMDVDDAVLCILHLELRCTENKLSNLWNAGFRDRKTPASVKEYETDIEEIVNEGKLGLVTHQNQWSFPTNRGKDGVASDFSLKGEFGRTILSRSDKIVDVALRFHTEEERIEWKSVLKKYGEIIDFLGQRTHFDDDKIEIFQRLVDEYAEDWREIAGRDGQTNYEHFMYTSHVSHYLRLYGNLYRYSQQGFEAMMSRVKCIYHKCTSRGGHGAKDRSHILQICHFLIRNMLWNSGHGEAYFQAKYGQDSDIEKSSLFL